MKALESLAVQGRVGLHTKSYLLRKWMRKRLSLWAKAGGTIVSLSSSVREKDLFGFFFSPMKHFNRAILEIGSTKEVAKMSLGN